MKVLPNRVVSGRKPKLGQNFLVDLDAMQRIVDALGDISETTVVEIGPGEAALTELLAKRAGRLIAVELDRVLAAQLRMRFTPDQRGNPGGRHSADGPWDGAGVNAGAAARSASDGIV